MILWKHGGGGWWGGRQRSGGGIKRTVIATAPRQIVELEGGERNVVRKRGSPDSVIGYVLFFGSILTSRISVKAWE